MTTWSTKPSSRIVSSKRRLQMINFLYKFLALSRRSSIEKCSKKKIIDLHAIMFMICLPWTFVVLSKINQILTNCFRLHTTSAITFSYYKRNKSPPIHSMECVMQSVVKILPRIMLECLKRHHCLMNGAREQFAYVLVLFFCQIVKMSMHIAKHGRRNRDVATVFCSERITRGWSYRFDLLAERRSEA